MNYLTVLRSRKMRQKILDQLTFIPDPVMLKLQYWLKLGRIPNLKQPERFTEKVQWYKMHYRNPLMNQCVDKYLVRDFVKSKGLKDILVDLYGKYNSITDITWSELPESFVIKTTHGSGGLNVVLCSSKTHLDVEDLVDKMTEWNKAIVESSGGREWAYYELKPGLVVEKLLVNEVNPAAGINDYKLFCFNGKPECIVVDVDRYVGHRRNFYDTRWNNLHVASDCQSTDKEVEKPVNLAEMLTVAEKLSEDFPFVRVDLYSVGEKLYFGELTFYPWSGYVQFSPDSFDFRLGEQFILPEERPE